MSGGSEYGGSGGFEESHVRGNGLVRVGIRLEG